jgi:hypothetical protein
MGIITIGFAAFCLLVFLPLYRRRFGQSWGKAIVLTIVAWFALNISASLLLAALSTSP